MNKLFALSFTLFCLFACQKQPDLFKSEFGKYQTIFPGKVKLSDKNILLDSLGIVKVELAHWENEQVACWVSTAQYSTEQLNSYAQDTSIFFAQLQAAALQNLGLQLKAEQRDSNKLGLSFTAESIDQKANYRIIWKGNYIYQLGWLYKPNSPDSLWTEKENLFFKSLTIQ